MQRLEVSGAVRPIYGSLGVKRLRLFVPCRSKKLCEMTFVGNLFQYVVPWIVCWVETLRFVVLEVNMATNICNGAFCVVTEYSVTGYERKLCDRLWLRTLWEVMTGNCVTDCDSGHYERLWQVAVWQIVTQDIMRGYDKTEFKCYQSVQYDRLWQNRLYKLWLSTV